MFCFAPAPPLPLASVAVCILHLLPHVYTFRGMAMVSLQIGQPLDSTSTAHRMQQHMCPQGTKAHAMGLDTQMMQVLEASLELAASSLRGLLCLGASVSSSPDAFAEVSERRFLDQVANFIIAGPGSSN